MKALWNAEKQKRILFLCNNYAQVEVAYLIANSSQLNFIIYSNIDPVSTLEKLKRFKKKADIKFVFNFNSILFTFPNVSCVITFVGHISPVLRSEFTNVLKLAIKTKTPIVEVPHGLFQYGFGFSDDSSIIESASTDYGFGLPYDSIVPNKVSF